MINPLTSFNLAAWRFNKRPRPCVTKHWGILNFEGDVWSNNVFGTPEAAREHLLTLYSEEVVDRDFRIVQVTVTVEAEVWQQSFMIKVASPPKELPAHV